MARTHADDFNELLMARWQNPYNRCAICGSELDEGAGPNTVYHKHRLPRAAEKSAPTYARRSGARLAEMDGAAS